MTIFILEDDAALCKGIVLALEERMRTFFSFSCLASAREALKNHVPDLFILDVGLTDGSGLDFCKELRNSGFTTPILMLTANDTELDMVTGLQAGADDYVTKPFSLSVLRARIDALLRRSTPQDKQEPVTDAFGFYFDFTHLHFKKGGQVIALSKTEACLLSLLYTNKGHTLTRDVLLDRIWQGDAEYVDENALSVSIRRLRAKIEDDPSHPKFIKTVHGIGYQWSLCL